MVTDTTQEHPYALLLAEFAVASARDLPGEIIADAANRVTDSVGVSLAATAVDDPAASYRAIEQVMRARGGTPEATPLTGGEKLPASSAAMINGTLAHSLDFDDTHLPSVLHPSSSVVPAAMALAEARGRSGPELLRAVAVGDEVLQPPRHGWLPA